MSESETNVTLRFIRKEENGYDINGWWWRYTVTDPTTGLSETIKGKGAGSTDEQRRECRARLLKRVSNA